MESQLSMFQLLGEYETPILPVEKQKAGTKAWIIKWSARILKENGYQEEWHGVCTRPVVLEEDTDETDGFQAAHTIKGPYMGWYGGTEELFTRRPTWNDCVMWAEKNRKPDDPEDVRYYDVRADWKAIYRYEDGW